MPPGSQSPAKESSKQRSLRIELLYLRRGRGWLWSKYLWSFLALVVAGGYVAWLGIGGEPAAAHLSPGPLANPHAAMNTKCADCHTAYVSTTESGEGVNWLSQKLLGVAGNAHTSDTNCSKCHQQQAKPHHSKQLAAEVASCASCHADHQGTSADLARPGDKVCTICHEGIGVHRSGSDFTPPIDNVAFFGRASEAKPAHPPFRSLPKQDDNNFKFNHGLHLLPGQWARGGDEKNAWTLEKIAAELRGGYKPVSDLDHRVQLDCASCHVPQQGNPAAQYGAYMLPIRYEQHCKACHALDVNAKAPGNDQAAHAQKPMLLVPHGLNQREIDEFLVGIAAKQKSEPLQPRFPDEIKLPIPGMTPSKEQPQAIEAFAHDEKQVDQWRNKLRDITCAKCHVSEITPVAGSADDRFKQAVGFAPPKLLARWLTHGQFDHRAHQSWAKCQECHTGAKPPESDEKPLLDDQNVLIPQIEVCAKCHAPVSTHPTFKAGARFDCAECHRYHPGVP